MHRNLSGCTNPGMKLQKCRSDRRQWVDKQGRAGDII